MRTQQPAQFNAQLAIVHVHRRNDPQSGKLGGLGRCGVLSNGSRVIEDTAQMRCCVVMVEQTLPLFGIKKFHEFGQCLKLRL